MYGALNFHIRFFSSRAKGSRLYDIDGNEYIDYVLGQGPLLLGHSPRPVLDAVHQQLEQGLVYAAQHEAETELAELLTEVIPCAQKVRFDSTGSEAVITALRIARAYRNRPLVVKFEGHWHGWYDSLFISTSPSLEQAGPRELPPAVLPSEGKAGLPALIGGLGPVVQVSLTEAGVLHDYRDWILRDTATYQRFVAQLVPLGVRTISRGTWYLSSAHTEEDVESTLEKVDCALKQRS